MSRFAVIVVVSSSLLLTPISHAAPSGKRAQLAAQSSDRITTLARTIAVVTWAGRCNEMLVAQPAAGTLGVKWNPSEAHWDRAADEMLTAVMGRFDALHDAPEALQRMAKPFETNLSEDEAKDVLALSAEDRRQLDDFADTMTLAVTLLEHRPELKPGSPAYRDSLALLTGMAKLPTLKDVPKLPLAPKTMSDYRLARTSATNFYLTAMQGQLELFFFDQHERFAAIAAKAAKAAAKNPSKR